jgi:hypothetical protein
MFKKLKKIFAVVAMAKISQMLIMLQNVNKLSDVETYFRKFSF